MSVLRVALAPLDSLTLDSPLRVWRDGRVELRTLGQLAVSDKGAALQCFLHPADSLLTSIGLPALAPAKTRAAVGCAAQTLILGPLEQMHIAHSSRDSQGRVHIGWLPRPLLARLGQVLEPLALRLSGLYPAPYALPFSPDGTPTRAVLDDHLLVRWGAHQAQCEPLVDAPPADLLPPAEYLNGPLPDWGLQGGLLKPAHAATGWGRAVACVVATLLVWTLGLNLYSAGQAEQGQQLKTHMVEQVKQAFPQIPVVLNPLQQARQQLAKSADASPDGQGFIALLTRSAEAMPFMAGSVEALVYANGELHLNLLPDTPNAPPTATWDAALTQAGLQASPEANGWTLRPLAKAND